MVRLPRDVQEAVIAHSVAALPEEACGLLAVDAGGEVRVAYCLGNVERSSTRFTVDPDGHFAALCHAEGNGWQIGGAFHSHPRSAAAPSRTDVAGALDPDWVYLIVGLGGGTSEVRGWRIRGGEVIEEPITLIEGSTAPCP
ncbi:MAG TPA: M67 family metallopeptidase [Acidimicrobiia bacterium]|nr:M67 family metallopeptidase [Acidimicrobiia bacterium]